jgi:hypothetical protein
VQVFLQPEQRASINVRAVDVTVNDNLDNEDLVQDVSTAPDNVFLSENDDFYRRVRGVRTPDCPYLPHTLPQWGTFHSLHPTFVQVERLSCLKRGDALQLAIILACDSGSSYLIMTSSPQFVVPRLRVLFATYLPLHSCILGYLVPLVCYSTRCIRSSTR